MFKISSFRPPFFTSFYFSMTFRQPGFISVNLLNKKKLRFKIYIMPAPYFLVLESE